MPLVYEQSTAPSTEPVTATEVKLHLKVDFAADDNLIAMLIAAAREYVEEVTRRQLVTATFKLYLDSFPASASAAILLPKPVAASVTSIAYVDIDGDTQTWASSNYTADFVSEPGRVVLAYNKSWPNTRGQIKAVTVTYTAGYGAAASVPDDIKAAMMLLIGHWYEHREDVVVGTIVAPLRRSVDALLGPKIIPMVA